MTNANSTQKLGFAVLFLMRRRLAFGEVKLFAPNNKDNGGAKQLIKNKTREQQWKWLGSSYLWRSYIK